jgi:hypothetical protein
MQLQNSELGNNNIPIKKGKLLSVNRREVY